MKKPVVVKFGGGLMAAPERDAMLEAAARCGAIVAPGGGVFADTVRGEQARLGFSERAAHRLAIRAMDQTAEAIADLKPALALCAAAQDFRAAARLGRGAVWFPSPMALGADVPVSWDVTSDSLALWLAIALGAPRLVVLKAAAMPAGDGPSEWADAGLVDPYFPSLAARFSGEIVGVGQASAAALEGALLPSARAAA